MCGYQVPLSCTIAQTCSQMHVQVKHSLAHLQDPFPILAAIIAYIYFIRTKVGIKSCRCARECFIVHVFGYMFELLVTAWYIIVM